LKRKLAALLIGNANYEKGGKLINPVNDADDMAAKLKQYGFEVVKITDASHLDMDIALTNFKALLNSNDVGLFLFAGHGMQIDGENFLLAVDTDGTDEIAVKHSSLALNKVIDYMERSAASTKIIILDACRDNHWSGLGIARHQRAASRLSTRRAGRL